MREYMACQLPDESKCPFCAADRVFEDGPRYVYKCNSSWSDFGGWSRGPRCERDQARRVCRLLASELPSERQKQVEQFWPWIK